MEQFNYETAAAIALGLIVAYGLYELLMIGSRDPQLPPGPPTLPFLGNLASLPLENTYLKFTEWARTYGGVYSIKALSETIIVVSSLDGVQEIMEKNGACTASRPDFEPVVRFSGPGRYMLFAPYGPELRKFRRVVTEMIKPPSRKHVTSILVAEASQLLYETQHIPDKLYYHILRYTLSTLFSAVAGQRIPQFTSPLCKDFFRTWGMISDVCAAGHTPPVDQLPILNYIPDRFAGNWKAKCATIKRRLQDLLGGLKQEAEKRLAQEMPNGSFLETMLEMATDFDIDDEGIRSLTGALLFGGATTPASATLFIIYLAAAYPEYQRKVQEELDRVVGNERAPTVADLPNLPYLSFFLREVYRFRPVNSLTTHYSTEDQIYRGKVIPKNSTIFLNAWGACHDPELFHDPDTFNPDRFVGTQFGMKAEVEKGTDPEVLKRLDGLMFGAGRRRCPGIPVAMDMLGHVTASLLWAFEFSPPVDEHGQETKLDLWAFDCGLTNSLFPFKLNVKPRSQSHMHIVTQNYAASTPVFEPFELELGEDDKVYVQNAREALQL